MAAQQVHGCGAVGEGAGRGRPRPDRFAGGPATGGVRHGRYRLRPYISPARAAQHGVGLVALDELLAQSDFITVHLPKSPETIGLIGADELRKVKPAVHIVNVARGGIVDESALYLALKEGRVAGAAVDVFASEPCTDSPLFELDNVVATPHLGAGTTEAQEKAGTAVARSVTLALSGEPVPDAVNIPDSIAAEIETFPDLLVNLNV